MKRLIVVFGVAIFLVSLIACEPQPNSENTGQRNDVTVQPSSISLICGGQILSVGAGRSIHASVNPSNATNRNIVWQSSNHNVATVSSNGYVVAHSTGWVTITASVQSTSVSSSCMFNVTRPSVSLTSWNASSYFSFNASHTSSAGSTDWFSVSVSPHRGVRITSLSQLTVEITVTTRYRVTSTGPLLTNTNIGSCSVMFSSSNSPLMRSCTASVIRSWLPSGSTIVSRSYSYRVTFASGSVSN